MKTPGFSVLLAAVLTAMSSGVLRAEFFTASEIVARFNALGPDGWSFVTGGSGTERPFFPPTPAGAMPDVSAYASSLGPYGTPVIFSMSMGSGSEVSSGTAKLNYDATTGKTRNSDGTALSVGAAVLYQHYAAVTLNSCAGYNIFDYSFLPNTWQRSSDASLLLSAMVALNLADSANSVDWTSNKYLQYLLNIKNDGDYWVLDYNTNLRYSELGNFAVFMMEIDGEVFAQSPLYVTYASHLDNYGDGSSGNGDGNENGHAPEPATLLLWSLGSLGALGFRQYRKQSIKA